ncbi:MAG: OmpH family outer membrane protein [Rhodothermaceae bacterium TMED105]|nr:MAG: OmpH family outer membrane protein [Rhodothermaceae bacterium TMED105]|tara:strand:- start:2346 stop:2966 length:621 start_codon:yes stop_codon:yes gene_type:complete
MATDTMHSKKNRHSLGRVAVLGLLVALALPFMPGNTALDAHGQRLLGQRSNVGFIDTEIVMSKMPEFQGIQQQLDQLESNWESELTVLEEELQVLKEEYEAREILYTDEVKAQKLAEIEQKQAIVDGFLETKFGPDGEYYTRQRELMQPLQRTIHDAIKIIAEEEGYNLVLDRAQQIGLIYAEPEFDITQLVLVELGIEEEQNRVF